MLRILSVTIAALLASICVAIGAKAQEKNYTLKIGDFNELTVANSINVVYKSDPDSAGLAAYTCLPEKASAITFKSDKNKLKIQVISETPIDDLPTITVYSLALVKATNWGDSTLTIERTNPGAQFKAKVEGNGNIIALDIRATKVDATVQAGNGHIYISGKAQNAKYSNMSAGAIEAGDLEAINVKCTLMGTGSIDCFPIEKLSVLGAGSGTVYYRGAPQSISSHSLGVKIVDVN